MKLISSLAKYRYLLVAALTPALGIDTGWAQTTTPPVLVLTEVSDTVLTATVGGTSVGTVTELSPNHWRFDSGLSLAAGTTIAPTARAGWLEPAGESGLNIVTEELITHASGSTFGLDIVSDAPRIDIMVHMNDAIGTLPGPNPNSLPIMVEFDDKGDSSTVPEVSSTLGLLGAAVTGCFVLARFKLVRG
jgi:hypothetical protein